VLWVFWLILDTRLEAKNAWSVEKIDQWHYLFDRLGQLCKKTEITDAQGQKNIPKSVLEFQPYQNA
jgi:hypothetical protein